MSEPLSRREFVGAATAAGLLAVGCAQQGRMVRESQVAAATAACQPPVTRIRKVYLAKPVPTWPKPTLDVKAEMQRIEKILADLASDMPGVQLDGGELYRVPDDVPASVEALGGPDGVLVFNLTSTVGQHLHKLTALGLPTVLYAQPYSGHDWSAVVGLQAAGHRVFCRATSDYGELAEACRLIRTAHALRSTRILYVNTEPYPEKSAATVKERIGPEVVWIEPDRMSAAYQAVAADAAEAEAREWIAGAVKVVEPSREDMAGAGRLYLALRKLMEEEKAQAVTINCLGMFRAGQLPAYPCLAFSKLNNVGLTGVCEADIASTLTQLMFSYAFGVPGFVSDPVIDTSNDTVIHAHCVSSTRMDGPAGPAAPYLIRSHLEDNKGASLQVRMRIGQVITAAKLTDLDTMLISTGTILDNPDVDRGCRTKITTKVADARKIMHGYGGGLHRVIFYGDRVAAIKDLAVLMQLKVVEEC